MYFPITFQHVEGSADLASIFYGSFMHKDGTKYTLEELISYVLQGKCKYTYTVNYVGVEQYDKWGNIDEVVDIIHFDEKKHDLKDLRFVTEITAGLEEFPGGIGYHNNRYHKPGFQKHRRIKIVIINGKLHTAYPSKWHIPSNSLLQNSNLSTNFLKVFADAMNKMPTFIWMGKESTDYVPPYKIVPDAVRLVTGEASLDPINMAYSQTMAGSAGMRKRVHRLETSEEDTKNNKKMQYLKMQEKPPPSDDRLKVMASAHARKKKSTQAAGAPMTKDQAAKEYKREERRERDRMKERQRQKDAMQHVRFGKWRESRRELEN